MDEIRVINTEMLDALAASAQGCERGRKNLNFHASYDEACQRLLNAVEPHSYIRPHRHLTPPKPETFVVLRGRFAVLLFDDLGEIKRVICIGGDEETIGVDLPPAVWHSVLSLESGSVFFETKPGPYSPLSDKDWAPWAPPEGADEADRYRQMLHRRVCAFLELSNSC